MALRFISFLLLPIIPLWAFLLSLKDFKKFYGYCLFIIFAIFLNLCGTFRPQDDIYRYIEGYNHFLVGIDWLSRIDLYYTGCIIIFTKLGLSVIYVYIFWIVVYYTGMYLCIYELTKYLNRNIVSLLLLLCAIFFISPFHFSILRFYTASFWFIFLVKRVEGENKSLKYSLWLLVCPLIHYMYWVPIGIYYVYRFFRPKVRTLVFLFLVTWGLSFLDYVSILEHFGLNIPGADYYLSSERNAAMEASYNLGKYLYLPLFLSLLYLLYIQYKDRKKLTDENYRLLGLAFWGLIVLNLVSASWDFTIRFRSVAEWLTIFSIACYYQRTHDIRYMNFVLVFPFCFILSNWDFFFVSGPAYFNYYDVFFSNMYSAWTYCTDVLNGI